VVEKLIPIGVKGNKTSRERASDAIKGYLEALSFLRMRRKSIASEPERIAWFSRNNRVAYTTLCCHKEKLHYNTKHQF